MGCLDNIVGLSRKDCDCFNDGRPANWSLSHSGLYLDELDGLSQQNINTSKDCGEGTIWNIMSKALINGEITFRTDILSSLHRKYKDRFDPFQGVIGFQQINGSAPNITGNNLLGVRLESNCLKGSCITLKGIDAFFDTTVVGLQVDVYRSDLPTPIDSFLIDTTAFQKKINTLPAPKEYPLYIDGLPEFYYSFVYNLPPGVKPLNTRLYTCSCNRTTSPWAKWLYADGIKAPAFINVAALDSLSGTTYTYGINLVAELSCKKGNIICEDGHVWDFMNDDIALNIAYAIQEASGIKLINQILERPDSAYFALNEEQLIGLATQYTIAYNQRIAYLAANMKPTNDCFTCSDQIRGVAILS